MDILHFKNLFESLDTLTKAPVQYQAVTVNALKSCPVFLLVV